MPFNTTTGRSVSVTEVGEPVTLGLYGRAQPQGAVTALTGETVVDKAGRFIVRVAPGEYFPYLANSRGVRMAVDARKQPPVVVKEGETTTYNMLITPEIKPEEKLQGGTKAHRRLVDEAVRSDGANSRSNSASSITPSTKPSYGACSCASWLPSAARPCRNCAPSLTEPQKARYCAGWDSPCGRSATHGLCRL